MDIWSGPGPKLTERVTLCAYQLLTKSAWCILYTVHQRVHLIVCIHYTVYSVYSIQCRLLVQSAAIISVLLIVLLSAATLTDVTALYWVVEQIIELNLILLNRRNFFNICTKLHFFYFTLHHFSTIYCAQIIPLSGSRMEELTGDNYASVNSDRDNASVNIDKEVYTALAVKCTVQYNQYIPELDGAIMYQSGGDQLY